MITAVILEIQEQFGRHQVVFQFEDENGVVVGSGPCVELRPVDEDHQAWLDARVPAFTDILNTPQPTDEESLIAQVLDYDPEVIKSALGIDDTQVDQLDTKLTSIKQVAPVDGATTFSIEITP